MQAGYINDVLSGKCNGRCRVQTVMRLRGVGRAPASAHRFRAPVVSRASSANRPERHTR